MNDKELKNIIGQIGTEITDNNARVRFTQYGGGTDEMMIVATKHGFIRLGLLMLKAAYASSKEEQKKIASDIETMITPDSDCCFDWIEKKRNIRRGRVIAGVEGRRIFCLNNIYCTHSYYGPWACKWYQSNH